MHSRYFVDLVCLDCGNRTAANAMALDCPACESQWLDAIYDYPVVAKSWAQGLAGRQTSLWRYAELLPIEGPDLEVSLQEGFTPLLKLRQYERMFDHHHLFIKDERQGPTSSFKDRQAALAVTALKQAGISECVLASTGNAGTAYAAYCARAGIKLWLFLTNLVPVEKMREAALYGAEVVNVEGSYDEVKHVAAEFARRKGLHLDRGARAIPGKESMKTLAFEIAEQLGLVFDHAKSVWVAPDWYIQAVSGGIGPLGVWKGFQELRTMQLIDKIPRMGIVQVAGCSPMVEAFQSGKAAADPVTPRTLIHVLATGDPGRSYAHLHEALLSNRGTMLAVDDGEAFAAMRKLASTAGLSVEPAAAVAFAGLERMFYDGIIDQDEIVVVNCSGHTFPAESHVLGDQYLLNLERESRGRQQLGQTSDGFGATLRSLEEQTTTILVVDDNPHDRRLLRRLLKSHKNYRVFEAQSGREALRQIGEHVPHLVITDLNMPEMDGLTFIEQLKWNPKTASIPIIVVSARILTNEDRKTLGSYAQSVWIKGEFETRQLVQHIVSRLDGVPADEFATSLMTPSNTDDEKGGEAPEVCVLVIDDDQTSARSISSSLDNSNRFNVIFATNARYGLSLLYERRPDLVIFELDLPDIHGFDLIDMVRKDAKLRQTALIAYTHSQLTEADTRRLNAAHVRILKKDTLTQEILLFTINEALALIQ